MLPASCRNRTVCIVLRKSYKPSVYLSGKTEPRCEKRQCVDLHSHWIFVVAPITPFCGQSRGYSSFLSPFVDGLLCFRPFTNGTDSHAICDLSYTSTFYAAISQAFEDGSVRFWSCVVRSGAALLGFLEEALYKQHL